MMEIYNEQVRDLLNPGSLKVKGGLKVRQHPKQGFYGKYIYSAVPLNSWQAIDKLYLLQSFVKYMPWQNRELQ